LPETLLVLGATGLLGQAVLAEAARRGLSAIGVARSRAEHDLDVAQLSELEAFVRGSVRERSPAAGRSPAAERSLAAVINCVASTSLAACEQQPGLAYAVNARVPALLAELAVELGFRFVQISSDHYFSGDRAALHDETAAVRLLNEYARTKYAGEAFALTAPSALVVRTNIVGLRGWPGRPTFAEWALAALHGGEPIALYDDFYTSSMHSRACAEAVLDLLQLRASGLVNVASSQVASKREFVHALAAAAGLSASGLRGGSVRELRPRRAESLGLDVSRAERLLARRLPGLRETAQAIAHEWQRTVGMQGVVVEGAVAVEGGLTTERKGGS
jgi:dTDP-4-dehydrorhamnose reductase